MTTECEAVKLISDLVRRHGPATIEQRLGLSDGAVRSWLRRGIRPRPAVRQKLAEFFDVPIASWETSTESPSSPPTSPATGQDAPPVAVALPKEVKAFADGIGAGSDADPQAIVVELLASLRDQLRAGDLAPRERAQVSTAATSAARLLARLAGRLELTESQIARSEVFRRLTRRAIESLRPYPDACEAFTSALEAHERGDAP
jgi:hypothetical protein